MHNTAGAHGLGPHVVGHRVVVRRLVRGETGPSGGPAMTDVLGTCTSWDDESCTVQPESGPEVRILLADVVTGKPVPPRRSVRHRVSARDVEQHTAVLWPAMEFAEVGGWLLRAAPPEGGRKLRRANSVLAMGDPGVPFAEAEARIREFYATHDQGPLAQVEVDGAVERWFLAAGWSLLPTGEAACLIASVSRALRAARAGVDLEVGYDEDGPRVRVATPDGVAVGRAAVDGDWVGIHELSVAPERRREGLGRAVVAALLDWGAERGAATAWLHVETDNPAARALYEGLGFREHHRYRYLAPVTVSQADRRGRDAPPE